MRPSSAQSRITLKWQELLLRNKSMTLMGCYMLANCSWQSIRNHPSIASDRVSSVRILRENSSFRRFCSNHLDKSKSLPW